MKSSKTGTECSSKQKEVTVFYKEDYCYSKYGKAPVCTRKSPDIINMHGKAEHATIDVLSNFQNTASMSRGWVFVKVIRAQI